MFFEAIAREDLKSLSNVECRLLINAKEHDAFLQDAVNSAKKEILIVSPWVTLTAIERINILHVMEMAVKQGIKVFVYTDFEFNTSDDNKKRGQNNDVFEIMTQFKNKGIEAQFVNKMHSKLVIKDRDLLCVGSFNWLSAQREGNYVRHETSIVYQGSNNDLANEIERLKESFESHLSKLKG